jgi:hypothetical protein
MLFQVTIAKIAPTVAVAIISHVEKLIFEVIFEKFIVIVSKLQPKKSPKTITPTIESTFVTVNIF